MQRNDTHDYEGNIQIRIIESAVTVSRDGKATAADEMISTANPKARKTADLFYKKHILKTWDDAGKIQTPYKGYFPEYSPKIGIMIRVIKVDVGFGTKSKVLVSPTGYPTFKRIWVPKGRKVTSVITENW